MQHKLRPAQREILQGESETPSGPAYSLSLYPGGTRTVMLQILAVFALFAVVRNNLATPAHMRRLAMVCLINGSFLSLFAMAQFFSTSKHNLVYWTIPTEGEVFGPFICRNHFPFYVNLCLGLGLGLLLSSPALQGVRGTMSRLGRHGWEGVRDLINMLNRPQLLWISGAMALMLAANICSQSRGGMLATLGGILVCLLLRGAAAKRWTSGAGVLLVILIGAMVLVALFGYGAVEDRLTTSWKTDSAQEPRFSMGLRLLPLIPRYLVWGTGFGTFEQVEPLTRTAGDQTWVIYGHAHDEYLEMLIEAGVPGLVLFLAILGFVGYRGYRALRVGSSATAALALGGLFALTTVILHSAVDFGLRIPAIILLASVICAMLVGLTDERAGASSSASTGLMTFRLAGLAAPLAAVAVLAIAWLLLWEGGRAEEAERYRKAALASMLEPSSDARTRQLSYLDVATQLSPEDAQLQIQLARAHQEAFLVLQNQHAHGPGRARLADQRPQALPPGPRPVSAIRGTEHETGHRGSCPSARRFVAGLHGSGLAPHAVRGGRLVSRRRAGGASEGSPTRPRYGRMAPMPVVQRRKP